MTDPAGSGRLIGRRQTALVGAASVYSAAVAYLVLLVAARGLTPADNAQFLVFWALLFGSFGVVTGITPESARAAHDGRGTLAGESRRAPIVAAGAIFGSLVGALIATTSFAWNGTVLPGQPDAIIIVAVACTAYSGHLALWGILTGLRRWRGMAALMIAESSVRLAAVSGVVLFGGGQLGSLMVASAVSAATWIVLAVMPRVREQLRRRSDLPMSAELRQIALSCAASTASAALTVGFPVLLAITSSPIDMSLAAGVILAVTLTRAPLLVPLTTFQGVALTYFLRHRSRGVGSLTPILGIVLLVSVAGAGLAWLVGPWLYTLLLGGSYRIGGATLAGLVIAAGCLAALTVSGVCCLAVRRSGAFAAGWILATAATIGVLAVPGDLAVRVVVGLLVGPLAGLVIHLVGLARTSDRSAGNGLLASRPPGTC